MEYYLIGIFLVGALLFVALPLLAPHKRLHSLEELFENREAKNIDYLAAKKKLVSDNISDLEFEYRMGKLSKEDFERLQQGSTKEAGEVDKAMSALKINEEIEQRIENKISKRRKLK